MKLGTLILILFILPGAAFGQSRARLDAIWNAADARIAHQVDVWFDDGEFPAVIQLIRVQTHLHPSSYDLATDLGWMLENVERYPEAEAEYKRYLKANPQDKDAALPLATFYAQAARFRRAVYPGATPQALYAKIPPLLEPALPRRPHPNLWRVLAQAYERLGRLEDARRVLRRYIALHPQDATAKNNLARVERKIKEKGAKG